MLGGMLKNKTLNIRYFEHLAIMEKLRLNLPSCHKELENWTNYVKQFSDNAQQAVQDGFLRAGKQTRQALYFP